MGLTRKSWMVSGVLLVAGCQTLTAESDVPAVITDPTDASRTALHDALSEAFNDTEVTLADNALMQTSLLTIEIGARRTIENPPLTGRVLEKPMQFRLVKNGDDCVLIDLRNQSRHKLENTTCAPE